MRDRLGGFHLDLQGADAQVPGPHRACRRANPVAPCADPVRSFTKPPSPRDKLGAAPGNLVGAARKPAIPRRERASPAAQPSPGRRRRPTSHHGCSVGAWHCKVLSSSKRGGPARNLSESPTKPRWPCAGPPARHLRRQAPHNATCAGSAHRLPRVRASFTQRAVSFAGRAGSFTEEVVSFPERAPRSMERTGISLNQAESLAEQPGSSVGREESFDKCAKSYAKPAGCSAERAGCSAGGQGAHRRKATGSPEPAGRSGCPRASAAPSSLDSITAGENVTSVE